MSQMAIRLGMFLILSGIFLQDLNAQVQFNQQWPGFRGPMACGFIENAKPPVSWSMDSLRNIKWKTAIPGLGHSCPVIWDKFLFVTTACSEKTDESLKVGLYGDIDMAADSGIMAFKVYCLDKNSGAIIWERTACKGIPKSKRHTKS